MYDLAQIREYGISSGWGRRALHLRRIILVMAPLSHLLLLLLVHEVLVIMS
jgi:hypothetical protein